MLTASQLDLDLQSGRAHFLNRPWSIFIHCKCCPPLKNGSAWDTYLFHIRITFIDGKVHTRIA